MEQAYWLRRKREAAAMAQAADNSKVRLIHYQLAGAYSVKAAVAQAEARALAADATAVGEPD